MTQQGGSGDIKLKLYEAVKDLVGPGSINDRLRWATAVIRPLIEHDIPTDPGSLVERFMKVRHRLTVDHQFLKDAPVPVTDSEGAELANELLDLFAMTCDPSYFGKVLHRSE